MTTTDLLTSEIKEGDVVSLFMQFDSSWYRGRVIEINDTHIKMEHYHAEEQSHFDGVGNISKTKCRYAYPIDQVVAYGIIEEVL